MARFLIDIYQAVLQNFTRLEFKDIGDFFDTYAVLLKTTHTMLSKFLDINPAMKTPVAHKYPQHDELLRMLVDIINSENIEYIIINSLMLAEDNLKGGQSTGITNKFWVDHLKMQSNQIVKDGHSHGLVRMKAQKMIKNALRCLNLIVELSLINI